MITSPSRDDNNMIETDHASTAMSNDNLDTSNVIATKDIEENDEEYDFGNMTGFQMLTRQLTICRLRKNVDPTWKQKARDTLSPVILLLYVASSFFYTAGGIVCLVRAEQLYDVLSSWYPWYAFGSYLVVQGVVTTLSDVVYVDQPSIWHPVDRSFALLGILFMISSLVVATASQEVRRDHVGGLVAVYLGILLSFFIFALEWQYKAKGDIRAFVLCHSGWHIFAPVGYMGLVLSL